MIEKAVGRRIRELRKERRLSQEKLAKISGKARTYVAEIETGKRNPTVESLFPMVKALGLSLAEFFDSPLFEESGAEGC